MTCAPLTFLPDSQVLVSIVPGFLKEKIGGEFRIPPPILNEQNPDDAVAKR